jgi:1-phosphatidylinositol-4-phosphate 5-kinase
LIRATILTSVFRINLQRYSVLGNVDPHDLLKLQRWRKKNSGQSTAQKSYVKGKVIDGEHELYTLSIAVMIGVRQSISRTNVELNSGDAKRWVRIQDFRTTEKYEFRPKGDGQTPPHLLAHTFKFKDYSPVVFAYLRRMYGVNEFDFLLSVCGNANFIEFISNAKSGQFFFYSSDGRYMIKTMTNAESKFLRRILPQYFKHCCENPNTIMTRFFGMYRVKLYHLRRNVKFVVMNSVYYTDKPLQSFYDLKGSTIGRDAKPGQAVLKDNDLRRSLPDGAIALKPDQCSSLRSQVVADCDFLQQMEIMDYSMLVGVHHIPHHHQQPPRNGNNQQLPVSIQQSESSPLKLSTSPAESDHSSGPLRRDIVRSQSRHRRNPSLKNLSFDDGLDDDESSYLLGSSSHPSHGGTSSVCTDEETERKKLATIEKLYWPFHLWFDIHGYRRLYPLESPYNHFSEDDDKKLKGYNIPTFVAPPSDRKDGGYEMYTKGVSLPMIVKDHTGIERICDGKIFYMGIIDILQEYTARKSLESTYRSFLNGRGSSTQVSCAPPPAYSDRFVQFFEEYTIRRPCKSEGKKQLQIESSSSELPNSAAERTE